MQIRTKIVVGLIGLLASVLSLEAGAVTPANTQLTNSATLTYSGNPTGLSDSVTVTIELVPTAVTIAQGATAPNASVNKAENQSYSASYVVQSNANGPDTYSVAAVYTSTNDVSGAALPTTSTASLTLGATAASASSTGQTITVPADGASDGEVNGLQNGDDVVIGTSTFEITGISDSASGSSTITVDASVTVSVGDGIYEYQSFTTDVSDVGSQGGATNKLDLQTTVTSDTDGSAQFLSDVDINIVAITFTKFVRETSGGCATAGCGSAVTTSYDNGVDGAKTYYDAGVEAAPGTPWSTCWSSRRARQASAEPSLTIRCPISRPIRPEPPD
ncbi:MAG: hypothetical protein U5O39_15320 [Gammaproteobacteria bacterium]|nr:hypothetical protein [Gammaproteobacteria bacterium]